MDARTHWENVYRSKTDRELSWFQDQPEPSLTLILETSNGGGRVIEIGGGSSCLIDHLLEGSFERLAVLDISPAALDRAKSRLGNRANRVEWIEADVTADPDIGQFDVWHDRAVFHFLTEARDRERYV